MDEPIGFMAKAPVSEWNKRIGVDYPGVFKAVLKGTLAVATANAPGALSAVIDGIFAFRVDDAKRPPEDLAWLLSRRALARAMAELTVEAAQRYSLSTLDKREFIAALDRALEGAEIWIEPKFFDRPAEHPIIDAVMPQFQRWLMRLGLNLAEAQSVQRRLAAYFTFALHREWAEHAEAYAPIDAKIREFQTPFSKADEKERAWLRNTAYLERQLQEPIFDEAFGLAQIYVPLRASYLRRESKRLSHRIRHDEALAERQPRIIVDLDHHLTDWHNKGSKDDFFRVICGGPGCGKTSFAKIWAAKLSREGHRVLYVPLHRLDLRDENPDVQAVLREFLSDLNMLPHDPLDSREGESRLTLLFDGLDELAMQGRAGQEVARNFIQAVETKLGRINDRADRLVQVVFGGRDVAVEGARVPEYKILHVLPYPVNISEPPNLRYELVEHPEMMVGNHAPGNGVPPILLPLVHSAEHRLKVTRKIIKHMRPEYEYSCNRWWQQFGEATGEVYEGIPISLLKAELEDLLAQPLLNYLLALSYRRGKLDFSSAPNLNWIYRDLLDSVYDRRWGPAPHPATRALSSEEFDHLLDELGLSTWHGAGRTISETEVEEACKRAGLQEQLADFKEGARAGAISLLAAFYFRQSAKIQGERTFEFTHKTFREYLTSRRIVRCMEDIHEDRSLNRKSRQRGRTEEEALVKWIEITGPTAMDRDLAAFIEREVALCNPRTVGAWRRTFGDLFSNQLHDGLPMHRTPLSTFGEMCRQARNAEEALLVANFCCASFLGRESEVTWPSRFALRNMLARLAQGNQEGLVFSCLGWLSARCADEAAVLQRVNLSNANLTRANLSGANLEGAYLDRSNLASANLRNANLQAANLGWANLCGADLRGAALQRAYLGWAHLEGADLGGANLDRANLGWADLVGAKGLDVALSHARSCWRAKIERKWVERLALDFEKIGFEVVGDLDDD